MLGPLGMGPCALMPAGKAPGPPTGIDMDAGGILGIGMPCDPGGIGRGGICLGWGMPGPCIPNAKKCKEFIKFQLMCDIVLSIQQYQSILK